MTTISKELENLEKLVKMGNCNVTYSDIIEVFKRIKNKGILNEPIVLNGQARYKKDMLTSQRSNKIEKNKRRLKRREEELEL